MELWQWVLGSYLVITALGYATWYEVTRPDDEEAWEVFGYAAMWPPLLAIAVGIGLIWCIGQVLRLPARLAMWLLPRGDDEDQPELPEARVVK